MLDVLSRLGVRVNFSDEKSGYALTSVSRGMLLDTLDIPGIAYAYTRNDQRMYYEDPIAKITPPERKTEPVPQVDIPYSRVATSLAPNGPYFAINEIGLSSLWKQHPEADGRGVRVAVADEGFDLLHPALQEAMDGAGNIVPKVADLTTLTTPDNDSSWVRFGESIMTRNRRFEARGRIWVAPEDGSYRFGIFTRHLVLGPEGNSHAKKLSLSVGVLWDPGGNQVWIDTDGDGSFKNQDVLGDYGATHSIGWFGTKRGNEDHRIPFGIKIDSEKDAIYIRIGQEHGALVSGALAGNTLTGGLFDGAAPGAQLIDEAFNRATLVAAMVHMVARPDVDILNRSGGVGRAYASNDFNYYGIEDFAQRVLERLIAVYDKPIVAYSAAVGTIHVNDYAGPEMLRRNRQLAPPYLDTTNSFIWDLPNGFVNSVLAPSANLETDSRYDPQDLTWGDGLRHFFRDDRFNPQAPDGYVIGSNESPTIPVVSGVIADLISEAKHEHVRYSAIRLNHAIFTGTRLLSDIPLSQQGYGLINAAKSWDQLSRMANADDPANSELTAFTVSRVEAGRSTEVQGFHADLTKPGEKIEGELWITRHGGYKAGRGYAFSLRGNDGTYELLDNKAILERDKPARVRFRTNGASGWKVAFLELRDVDADVVMQDIPLSVRVPDAPENVQPGIDKYESVIPPLRSENRYIYVGDDVQATRYVMRIPYTGPENISTRAFPGGRYRTTKKPDGESVDAAHHVGPIEELHSLVANDTPGTQVVFWENRGRPEYATQYDGATPDVPIHATLTVTKYGVTISKTPERMLSIRNRLAGVEGHVEFYDAKLATSEMQGQGNHRMTMVERNLPAGLVQWRLKVSSRISGRQADAYLFNCTGKNGCYIVSQQEITEKGALLTVDKPQAGTWKVIVRSREQLNVESAYKLSEAQLTPTQTGATDANTKHGSDEKWNVTLPDTTQYAAFRIAGTSGVEREKNGVLVAMTPLASDLP